MEGNRVMGKRKKLASAEFRLVPSIVNFRHGEVGCLVPLLADLSEPELNFGIGISASRPNMEAPNVLLIQL